MEMAIAVWCWPVAHSELVTKARCISGLEPHPYFWHGGRKSELRTASVNSLLPSLSQTINSRGSLFVSQSTMNNITLYISHSA